MRLFQLTFLLSFPLLLINDQGRQRCRSETWIDALPRADSQIAAFRDQIQSDVSSNASPRKQPIRHLSLAFGVVGNLLEISFLGW